MINGYLLQNHKWDDPYITYRYASNISHGFGWTYNPNTVINGCTSVLYPLILSCFGVVGIDIPTTGIIFYQLCLAFCGIIVCYILKSNQYVLSAMLAPFLILYNPILVWSIGLETTLFLLLGLLSIHYYYKDKFRLVSVLLAMDVLVRPDAIVLAGVLFLYHLTVKKTFPWKEICIFVVLILPWILFSQYRFGTFLPHTLSVKVTQGNLYESPLHNIMNRVISPMPAVFESSALVKKISLFTFLGVLIIGGYLFYRGLRQKFLTINQWGFILVLGLWGVFHIGGYSLLNVPVGYRWHLAPVAIIYCIIGAIGIEMIYIVLKKFLHTRVNQMVIVLLFMVILFPEVKFDYEQYLKVYHQRLRWVLFYEGGNWINENTPPTATVGVHDIGILGYYSRRQIIDCAGLITPGVAEHLSRGDLSWSLRNYRPDYFVQFNPPMPEADTPITEIWLNKAYTPVKTFRLPNAIREFVIYKKTSDADLPPAN